MDSLYYVLRCDSVANFIETVPDAQNKLGRGSTRSFRVTVHAGSLWQRIDSAAVDDTYEPISVVRNSSSILLRSCEQDNVRLSCALNVLYRLHSDVECQLLLAVERESDRLKLIGDDSGYGLKVGYQIWIDWTEQQQSRNGKSAGRRQNVPGSSMETRVVVYGKIPATVRYVGNLAGRLGLWFGVELAQPYSSIACTDGSYKSKRYFDCNENCGLFVALNNISLCDSYSTEATVPTVSRRLLPSDSLEVDTPRNMKVAPENAKTSSIPRPPLEIGERVVWISDYAPELGTVRWIGILPDSKLKEYTIGVEFDNPIGTGTGKYNNKQLFRTRQNHASLIPCLGLMKAEEFYGSAAHVPPPPSFIGESALSSVSTSTLDTVSKHGSRHDASSVHSVHVDDEDEVNLLNEKYESSRSVRSNLVDENSDCTDHGGFILVQTVPLGRNATSRSVKSSNESQHSTVDSLTGRSREVNSEYAPTETNSNSERSVYDQEREHCYQNVQKDETGRLLNRDTTAFSASSDYGYIERNRRSNSGDDISSRAVEQTIVPHNKLNQIGSVTLESSFQSPGLSCIERTSRSIGNIYCHQETEMAQTEKEVRQIPVSSGKSINNGFVDQLPYHTGRSTFYQRVESVDDPLNSVQASTVVPIRTKQPGTDVTPGGDSPTRNKGLAAGMAALNCIHRPSSRQSTYFDIYATEKTVSGASDKNQKSDDLSERNGSIQPPTDLRDGMEVLNKSLGVEGPISNVVPRTLGHDDLINCELDIGSVVEFNLENLRHYGVIRWLGCLTDKSVVIAGIELEEESDVAVDSVLCGSRVFDCAQRKAYFELLSKLRKDRRFTESSKFVYRLPDHLFGSIECLDIAGSVAPPEYSTLFVGANRGIQGHHNSCYMDATLFSMFAFSTVFDAILHRPRRHGSIGADIAKYDEVQAALRDGIVNPLRKNFYVRADKVLHLRQLLDQSSSVQGLMGDEKDPEEFLNSLLQQTLKADPFIHLSSGHDAYFYQLFMDKDDRVVLPTTQQLLELSCLQSDVKFSEVPSCLILQMPRFGKDYKMYRRIVPSLYLDITDILLHGIRECAICGSLATHECKQCFRQFGDGLDKIAFCTGCISKTHQANKRSGHNPTELTVNADYRRLIESRNGRHGTSVVTDSLNESLREKMELFAVICIQTSHYVAFVKSGSGPKASWMFFDSMADRKGEQHGYNIPAVECCPYLPAWLEDASYAEIHKHHEDRSLPDQMRRLLCDAYICMYQSSSLAEYR